MQVEASFQNTSEIAELVYKNLTIVKFADLTMDRTQLFVDNLQPDSNEVNSICFY